MFTNKLTKRRTKANDHITSTQGGDNPSLSLDKDKTIHGNQNQMLAGAFMRPLLVIDWSNFTCSTSTPRRYFWICPICIDFHPYLMV